MTNATAYSCTVWFESAETLDMQGELQFGKRKIEDNLH